MREQSDSSVIWHKVQPFSHIDPRTLCNIKREKKTKHIHSSHYDITHTYTSTSRGGSKRREVGWIHVTGWVKKNKTKSLHHDDLAIKGLTHSLTQHPFQKEPSVFHGETDHTKLHLNTCQFLHSLLPGRWRLLSFKSIWCVVGRLCAPFLTDVWKMVTLRRKMFSRQTITDEAEKLPEFRFLQLSFLNRY